MLVTFSLPESRSSWEFHLDNCYESLIKYDMNIGQGRVLLVKLDTIMNFNDHTVTHVTDD
jgi:hypothetical protein